MFAEGKCLVREGKRVMSIVKEKGNIDPRRRRRNERGISLERENIRESGESELRRIRQR